MRAAALALAILAGLAGCARQPPPPVDPGSQLAELQAAAARGDAARVAALIESEPGLAHASFEGVEGPLTAAARGGHVQVLRTLIAAGAEPRERDQGQRTPLHHARTPEVVDALLDAGVRPDVRARDGTTPAMTLAHSPEALERLLARGARTELRDESGLTALHHAGASSDTDALRSQALLCGYGADPDLTDEQGASARRAASGAAAVLFLAPGGACDDLRERFARAGPVAADTREALVQSTRCETGEASGCGRLGWAYEHGEGVPVDLVRSSELYRRGCDGAHAWSCYALGYSYRNGEGVPRDDARAVALFRQACEAGHAKSCAQLAWHFARGRGVARDEAAARAFYGKACAGGDEKSCATAGPLEAVGQARATARGEAAIR